MIFVYDYAFQWINQYWMIFPKLSLIHLTWFWKNFADRIQCIFPRSPRHNMAQHSTVQNKGRSLVLEAACYYCQLTIVILIFIYIWQKLEKTTFIIICEEFPHYRVEQFWELSINQMPFSIIKVLRNWFRALEAHEKFWILNLVFFYFSSA